MPVIDFEEWKKRYAQSPPKRPAVVTFYGAFHADRTGNLRSLTISIMVDDGDWSDLMEKVMENGGVGGENDDGEPFFLPWPCAAVDVHYPDEPDSDNSNQI